VPVDPKCTTATGNATSARPERFNAPDRTGTSASASALSAAASKASSHACSTAASTRANRESQSQSRRLRVATYGVASLVYSSNLTALPGPEPESMHLKAMFCSSTSGPSTVGVSPSNRTLQVTTSLKVSASSMTTPESKVSTSAASWPWMNLL